MVSSKSVGKTHTEEESDETAALDNVDEFLEFLFWNTADFVRDVFSTEEGSECVEDFVVVTLLDADEVVCNFCSVGLTAVDTDNLSTLLTLCGEESAWEDGVSGHVSRVCVCRVASPEDDAVSTVLDFS